MKGLVPSHNQELCVFVTTIDIEDVLADWLSGSIVGHINKADLCGAS